MFKIEAKSAKSSARAAKLETGHGVIETPFFMPIATRAAVKNLDTKELEKIGAQIILSNTYHLSLRPGLEVINKARGLHKFMAWNGPILTDSGGYQVFSLAKYRSISDQGVLFQNEIDGSKHLLTPEWVVEIQMTLGSDIIMVLDECLPYPCDYEYAKQSLARTTNWAERSKHQLEKFWEDKKIEYLNYKSLLFGIIQGGFYPDLREKSLNQLYQVGFDGYAIGGLAIGEPRDKTFEVVKQVAPMMPVDKPRYLMGMGMPEEIVMAVKEGIDMFDCVIPTRNARHGELFLWQDKSLVQSSFYQVLHITNNQFKEDMSKIDPICGCWVCETFSKSYLRHLFMTDENLGLRLASYHNLSFYLELMRILRKKIVSAEI